MSVVPKNMGTDIMRFARLEMKEVAEQHVVGHARVVDHLCDASGAVRAGALLTMLDSAGGVCGGLASLPDGWVVSTNMSARTVDRARAGELQIDSRVARQGRNNVVTSVEITDEASGRVLMDGVLTSAILVPENGPPVWQRPLHIAYPDDGLELFTMERWLDARVVDDHAVEMDLRDTLRNPWGILHGGVTAALIDAAVEHETGGALVDIVLHYVAPNRVGPVRAIARNLGRRSDGTVVRVEVRDEGADRLTALAVATAGRPGSG